jgi:hypothetical protein
MTKTRDAAPRPCEARDVLFTRRAISLCSVLFAIGCTRSEPRAPAAPTAPTTTVPAPSTSPTLTTAPGDAPQISRSVGVEGGIVVLWPRVVGSRETPQVPASIAQKLQARLAEVAARAAAGRPLDVRPEPERICPRSGCVAKSVGVLLAYASGGCAAVALLSGPGPSPAELVPWGGSIRLKARTVAFRDPPEQQVSVEDYLPCDALLGGLRDGEVEAAIRRKLD